jgi:hypothetical protein
MSQSSSPYKLAGLRAILDLAPSAAPIRHQLDNLELAIEQGSAQAFDMADGLIGSICKTIMGERKHTCEDGWVTVKLFRETITRLPLVPTGHPDQAQARNDLEETIRGLTTTVQGLYNLRRNHGVIAHGRDASAVILQGVHIELAARSADAIGCYLLSLHRDYARQPQPSNPLKYEDYQEFNEYTDDNYPVVIWDVPVSASEALFKCDPVGYQAALATFNAPEENGVEEEGDGA